MKEIEDLDSDLSIASLAIYLPQYNLHGTSTITILLMLLSLSQPISNKTNYHYIVQNFSTSYNSLELLITPTDSPSFSA